MIRHPNESYCEAPRTDAFAVGGRVWLDRSWLDRSWIDREVIRARRSRTIVPRVPWMENVREQLGPLSYCVLFQTLS